MTPWQRLEAQGTRQAVEKRKAQRLPIRIDEREGLRFTVPVCVLQRGVAVAVVRQVGRAIAARGET